MVPPLPQHHTMLDSTAAFKRGIDEIGEGTLGAESPALVPALMNLAASRILSGKLEEAEALVIRALGVSENGAQNGPDFVLQLNDLIRLSLKQSAYAVAEPLLLRMLAIKRSKGEDHPEVATVLASLATLRQALGRHESAEQLWRRVLEIREQTLAPNHFALATALEHLAEACAARGKIGEALELLQRAYTVRELTLGVDHSSLGASRDRIADLQLQASEETLDAPAGESPVSAPERYLLPSVDHSVASPPRPAWARSAVKQLQAMTSVVEREPSTKEGTAKPPTPILLPVPEVLAADGRSPDPGPAPYLDVLLSIRQELDDEYQAEAPKNRAAEMIASVVAAVVAAAKQWQKETVIGAIAAALLVVFVAVAYAWNSDRPGAAEQASALSGVSSPPAAPASVVSNRPVILANDPAPAPVTAPAGAIPLVTRSRPRIDDQRSAAKNTRGPTGISIPKVPSPVMAGLDSVVRARGASGSEVGESFVVQPPPLTVGSRPLTFERDDPVNQAQPARLIGTLPTPRIPAHLAGIEGEVRVRFTVDALGQPVISSLSVVSSSDKALTAAVLKVIPDLRFEPAQTGGPDPKPVGDVVQLEFLFRPNK